MNTIKIYDRQDLLEIQFEDIVKFHGKAAYMAIAAGFRVIEAAFEALYGDEIPNREDISVLSGHGGPGFRDVIEFITRANTRGVYTVDPTYPVAQYDPHRPTSYAYIFTRKNGASVEASLKEDYLPIDFYDYVKITREREFTAEEYVYIEQLKNDLAAKAFATPLDQLVNVKRLA